ncbi:hypothetical protein SNE32_16895, partial [Lysobacter sp. D1-1-M9]|uniref:DUF7002 family protein n=1 Tax=Novilysobacter longmucuonensis TaxID=3098603 RepID=UPI002FC88783
LPATWYEFINGRVFFWASEERLFRLLSARQYRETSHQVIAIDTRSLVEAHEDRVLVCHINSGNTHPFPHPRDFTIFKSIAEFPVKPSGKPVKEVVELTIDYSVPDITPHVLSVTEMKGSTRSRDIYVR